MATEMVELDLRGSSPLGLVVMRLPDPMRHPAMGHLKNSITYEVRSSRGEAYVKVGSSMGSAIYPVVMEYGRKPNSKPPPAAALVRWVHLVLKPPADEEYMIDVRLARKIGKRGIQGRFYMKKGYEKSESKIVPWFAEAFERMLDRIKS